MKDRAAIAVFETFVAEASALGMPVAPVEWSACAEPQRAAFRRLSTAADARTAFEMFITLVNGQFSPDSWRRCPLRWENLREPARQMWATIVSVSRGTQLELETRG